MKLSVNSSIWQIRLQCRFRPLRDWYGISINTITAMVYLIGLFLSQIMKMPEHPLRGSTPPFLMLMINRRFWVSCHRIDATNMQASCRVIDHLPTHHFILLSVKKAIFEIEIHQGSVSYKIPICKYIIEIAVALDLGEVEVVLQSTHARLDCC